MTQDETFKTKAKNIYEFLRARFLSLDKPAMRVTSLSLSFFLED